MTAHFAILPPSRDLEELGYVTEIAQFSALRLQEAPYLSSQDVAMMFSANGTMKSHEQESKFRQNFLELSPIKSQMAP